MYVKYKLENSKVNDKKCVWEIKQTMLLVLFWLLNIMETLDSHCKLKSAV